MRLGPVIDRIKASEIGFKLVDGLMAVADLAKAPGALPAAYVVPTRTRFVSEQEGAGLLVMGAEEDFDVVIVIGSGAAGVGRDRDQLEDLADAVIALLMGWTPDADLFRPVVPVGAGLAGVGSGRASWTIRFRTYSRLRKQG